MAPIAVGDALPDGQLGWFDENDQLQQVSVHALAAGKKVILFGVPGAFTPTCRSLRPVPCPVSSSHSLGDLRAFWPLCFGGRTVSVGSEAVIWALLGLVPVRIRNEYYRFSFEQQIYDNFFWVGVGVEFFLPCQMRFLLQVVSGREEQPCLCAERIVK